MYVPGAYTCMQASSEDGVGFPGTSVPHGYEPYGRWALSSHPRQELQVLITAGSSPALILNLEKIP